MYEVCYLERTEDLIDTLLADMIETIDLTPEPEPVCIGIPGGRSVSYIIAALRKLTDSRLSRLRLLLVDERLEGEKNIDTIMDAGLREMITAGRFSLDRILSGEHSLQLVLLGVGEDGHVASLFPNSFPHLNRDDTPFDVLVEHAPKPPKRRKTVSYTGFRELSPDAHYILLFLGEAKRDALIRFLTGESPYALPSAFFRDHMKQVTVITDLQEVHL